MRHTIFKILFLAMAVGLPFSSATFAQNDSAATEADLIALLQSDAAPADKALACKNLAIHGSANAVPELAKLLPNEQLSSWARIALEAIPDSAADAALRDATQSLQGKLLVGTINSIGVREDAEATDLLAAKLIDEDAEVASAAAVALGHIGSEAAADHLRGALADASPLVQSAIAEGCVLCAEQMWIDGNTDKAIEIYDEIRESELPKQRVIEATRGAILARGDEGIPMLMDLFSSSDKHMFNLALGTAREFPGTNVDKEFAKALADTTPDRAGLILLAMADRSDSVDLPTILAAAKEGPASVRLAAVRALGQVGDASCLPTLLEISLEQDNELRAQAQATLAELPGDAVNAQIVAQLDQASGTIYPLLIDLVGQRRIPAKDSLMKALAHNDAQVRAAALRALGETIDPDGLEVLIGQVIEPRHPGDVEIAQRALKAASIRMPDPNLCAAKLSEALTASDSLPTQIAILQTLGAVGGPKALETVGKAAGSSQDELQDVGSRLLGTWMTADAAPVLLDLSQQAESNKYKVRALRGYLRIARQFVLPEGERAAMCEKALAAATRQQEKELVLQILARYPNAPNLKLAMVAMGDPNLKDQATEVAMTIAQKVGASEADLQALLSQSDLGQIELEILSAQYGAGSQQKDVTALVQKAANDLPLVILSAPSYNDALGGDPVPGTQKQLTIRYKMNGQEGEATFTENAPIFLKKPN